MSSLILASASPQRRALLQGLGIPFTIFPSSVDEETCTISDPEKRALCLASLKAKDIAARHPGSWILGCDTLVWSSAGELLEKPRDREDARRMLFLQSGRVSTVYSGIVLLHPEGEEFSALSESRVRFGELREQDIDWWIGTGLWEGRSGAFQIDGPGQLLIERIEGDWTGIVGLPVFLLGELLRQAHAPFHPLHGVLS